MLPTAACISILLLTLIATFHTAKSFVEDGINEQFYSLSAVDARGHNVQMSSFIGKVIWQHAVCRTVAYYLHYLV